MGVRERILARQQERWLKKHPEGPREEAKVEASNELQARIDALEAREKSLDRIEASLLDIRKDSRKDRARASIGRLMGSPTKGIPKGIRMPDSMVTNRHLYTGGGSGKKAKLF